MTRRNIPLEFKDYIAQTQGFKSFSDLEKIGIPETKEIRERVIKTLTDIKRRYSQLSASIRKPYSEEVVKFTKLKSETSLQFAMRIDGKEVQLDNTSLNKIYNELAKD